jgi:hypothetical protein
MKIKEVNSQTGKEIVRDASEQEIAQRELDIIEGQKQKESIIEKENARKALLEKLGLTEDEAKLLLS